MIKINMFQAGYGDSILVQVETKENDFTNLLIDCGFNYKTNILPRLKNLLKDQTISRFIITHYDKDHINSAHTFLGNNGHYDSPSIVGIEQVWLNTFRHLQFSKRNTEELSIDENEQIKNYVSEMFPQSNLESYEGDIGAKQASTLGKVILEKEYPWNIDTKGNAICVENIKDINISEDVKLHLLTPNKKRLERLEREFILKLSGMGLNPNTDSVFDDAFELFNISNKKKTTNEGDILATKKIINSSTIKIFSKGTDYEKDDSVGNGSSISFILEAENKKVLFLADAFPEDVIVGLKQKYSDEPDYPIFFDAVKISHHGSFRNNSPDLFKIIDSGYFLFSTNGEHQSHKHPDVETICCIINRDLPSQITERNLIFNYELGHLKDFNTKELKKEFNYDIKTQVETEI
jgi:beta-lactamase superfamily II metal-dependent hydrolase